ncbi:FAD-binding oxidoreductase (plasmid) [Catenovulum adriaticum]|uniref:FAD-binding oxidoreductase n=2 Tax=Catenovulum adriaticum TaxID=2984846 RepID=A0ABY7ATA1_9ALTE|nr:FAD-binding oxidoreductase [Catenovulum sp. TS8]
MPITEKTQNIRSSQNGSVAIIGGGVAGSTIALRLAEIGIKVTLIEQSDSLVNGPPICHLHAGGSFYRDISDEQCLTLLNQSIDMISAFPQCVNVRPTVIAVPVHDKGSPSTILPRLEKLRRQYKQLVAEQPDKKRLGEPDQYFQTFSRLELENLATKPLPKQAICAQDWLIPVARKLDLDKLQYPVILVQEYGLSGFRFSALASLAAANLSKCDVLTHTQVTNIKENDDKNHARWQVSILDILNHQTKEMHFDYLINACGFRSGTLDDMLKVPRQRLVEFKAAYVARWENCQGQWPEVIFHGERGTPEGMAQLTPYPDGYFQLHGMTQDITLFENGLVKSEAKSAQPKLPQIYLNKIENGWPEPIVAQRTLGSISHVSRYIPEFSQAVVAAKPLYGAQQIPGEDPKLRAADVSFYGQYYARAEIVKASSALAASDTILQQLKQINLLNDDVHPSHLAEHYLPVTASVSLTSVVELASQIAEQRNYPSALARQI